MKLQTISILLLGVAFALACGGSATNNGIAQVNITGTFDINQGSQKPFSKSSNFTAIATNLDDASETWNVEIENNTYKTTTVRRSNILIEIKLNDMTLVSRIISREETDTTDTDSKKINLVTHVQSEMIKRLQNSTPQWSTLNHSKQTFKDLLSNETPVDNELSIQQVSRTSPQLAVILATHARLFSTNDPSQYNEAISLFSAAYKQIVSSAIINAYIDEVNKANLALSQIIASLHEGAKNSGIISIENFTEISKNFISENILTSLDQALEIPLFGTDIETAKTASPSTLFTFTFPTATTKDILGIASYSGKWIRSTTPQGITYTKSNENRTLQWMPTSQEAGKSYFYQLDAYGVNGKKTNKPKVVEIKVNSLQIQGQQRKVLPNTPILGPVYDSEYMYLISQLTNQQLQLDKYKFSDIDADAPDALLTPVSWLLDGISSVLDFKLNNQSLYLATENDGLWSLNKNFGINPDSSSIIVGKVTGSQMQIIGENIFTISNTYTSQTHIAPLDLSTSTSNEAFSNFSINSLTKLGSIQPNYLYLTHQNSGSLYNVTPSGLPVFAENFTPTGTQPLKRNLNYNRFQYDYLYTTMTAQRLQISNQKLIATTYTPATMLSTKGIIANGSDFFVGHQSQILSYTIYNSSQIIYEQSNDSRAVNYSNTPDSLQFIIRNLPEGVNTHQTGSILYSFGEEPSSTNTQTWYIKTHHIKPTD